MDADRSDQNISDCVATCCWARSDNRSSGRSCSKRHRLEGENCSLQHKGSNPVPWHASQQHAMVASASLDLVRSRWRRCHRSLEAPALLEVWETAAMTLKQLPPAQRVQSLEDAGQMPTFGCFPKGGPQCKPLQVRLYGSLEPARYKPAKPALTLPPALQELSTQLRIVAHLCHGCNSFALHKSSGTRGSTHRASVLHGTLFYYS